MKRLSFLLLVAVACFGCGDDRRDTLTFTSTMDVNTIRVSAQAGGTVVDLSFEEGDRVDSGQVLLRLDTEKPALQLEQSRAALDELAQQIEASRAQAQAAAVQRDNLRMRYERFSALLESDATTRQSVDDLYTQLEAAEQQLRASRSTLEALERKRRQVDAGIRLMERQLRDAVVTAPASGIVLVRYVDRGELVMPGSPLCELADLSTLWARVYIAEPDLPSLRLGQQVILRADGLPGKEFTGVLTWISDKAEFTPKTILTEETRTTLVFPARVTVRNPEGLLKIGMPVTVTARKAAL
ncbi:MAG: efflux RND transporter periplasmic adaptor subunit [Bacteroidota bacterium]|nr:efflux RND transporter periplasmic adaptor subunit [Bacteroidota bacterium]